MKRFYMFFTLFFLCFHIATAQEGVKKHTVNRGETIASIAKKYNVTPYDLQQANPRALDTIAAGDILIIPEAIIQTPVTKSVADSIKASITRSSISYTVKRGDTKFGLSKRFGLTIPELESQNPHIISGLQTQQVLEIYPSTSTSKPTASLTGKTHLVLKGETLWGISHDHGLTVEQLVNANSDIISGVLKAGQTLRIPETTQTTVAGDFETYVVQYGDTKYGLSKKFDMTIPELELQNPHIIPGLQAQHVLKIYPSASSSKPTTSIAGTTHLVLKGETLWGISHDNGLTVEQLVNANSDIISGVLKSGQTLRIPKTTQTTVAGDFETYVVKYGDTKFGLSKKFDTTIPELERQNPHIINLLMAGQTIKIPSAEVAVNPTQIPTDTAITETTETVTSVSDSLPSQEITTPADDVISNEVPSEAITSDETTASTVDSTYISYKIQPKETLFGLAKKAGMSMADFLVLNPQLKESVQIGTFIKMPNNGTIVSDPKTPNVTDLPKTTSRYVDLKTSASTSQPKKLLFFLPFSEMEYQNYAVNGYNFNGVSDDFKRAHLEFYKGANSAMDSLRALRLKLDVAVIEVQSAKRSSKIMALAKDNNIAQYDAIILPFYENVEEDIAEFTADSKIPVITASTIAHQSNTNNLYNALPSVNQQRLKVLNYMQSKQAHIIVLSDVHRAESRAFITDHVPNAEFVTIKKNGSFSTSELIEKFKKGQHNFVVLDSERNSVFLSVTTTLLSELSNYDLQLAVLEASLIPDTGDVSQKRYRILKMIFPSLTPAEQTISSKLFSDSYQKKYKLQPSKNVMLGFDITFDTLLRLMQDESFETSAEKDITEYSSLKFNYDKNTLGGFSNEGIYILQYDSDANIKEAN